MIDWKTIFVTSHFLMRSRAIATTFVYMYLIKRRWKRTRIDGTNTAARAKAAERAKAPTIRTSVRCVGTFCVREKCSSPSSVASSSRLLCVQDSMSSLSDNTHVLARQEAFKDFSYFDEETAPANVGKLIPLQSLKPTSAIILTGYLPENASRFSVNLTCKTFGNIALHFNPRLDRGYIVRNTKLRGSWEDEETCSPAGSSGCIFRRNSYMHLMIFCANDAFQIAINGEHFCSFYYRLPLAEITALEVNGTIEDIRTRQLNLFVYPDPSICRPSRTLILTTEEPLVDFLDVPITVGIGSEFRVGASLLIAGRLKLLPHSFYVNLQRGKTIYPHPLIPLHLNPRFLYGNSAPYVVMNCWNNGTWDHEERHQGHLSWMPGRDFLLIFVFALIAFDVSTKDTQYGWIIR